MTKDQFLKNEEANFKDYLDTLYKKHGEKLNYFEHNIEVPSHPFLSLTLGMETTLAVHRSQWYRTDDGRY